MSVSDLVPTLRPYLHASRFLQIALLVGFWLLGQAIVRASGLPLPGSIIGLLLVILLLARKKISPESLRLGAQWFLAEMMLFFIPAIPALTTHREFLGWLGLKILAIIIFGTLTVMAVTALTVDFCYRWKMRREALSNEEGA